MGDLMWGFIKNILLFIISIAVLILLVGGVLGFFDNVGDGAIILVLLAAVAYTVFFKVSKKSESKKDDTKAVESSQSGHASVENMPENTELYTGTSREKTSDTVFCTNCGKKITVSSKFCVFCGTEVKR